MVDELTHFLSSDVMNAEVVSGISVAFALIFFVPLLAVSAAFSVYCLFARQSVIPIAKVLSSLWLLACVPAGMLILMGYAFNSSKLNPLISVPLWIVAGLVPLWLPVGVRWLFGVERGDST